MGVLLLNDLGWGPKQAISSAFFEDLLDVINDKVEYQQIYNEIKEARQFYTFTLDYRNKTGEEIQLLLELVIVLIYCFDDKYKDRLSEVVIEVYKKSLVDLKVTLFKAYFLNQNRLMQKKTN